jgi:hypothetical protein
MPPIGLSMLFLLWPLLWYDPARAFTEYLSFHLSHVHYLQLFFGTILAVPPFPMSFPLAMTALTVPVVLLLTFAVGAVTLFWTHRHGVTHQIRWMIALNLFFAIALISMPETPIFGGIKHWLGSMAFFALVAGFGFDFLRIQITSRLAQRAPLRLAASLGLALLLIAPGMAASLQYRLFGTSYYNELAGGLAGAAEMGMHRQFWGYSGRYALDYVNRKAPRSSWVAFHNTTWDAVAWYQRDNLLRHDLRWRRDPPAYCQPGSLYLFHHQESFAQDKLNSWEGLNTSIPDEVISVDGVPMLSIYSCKDRDIKKASRHSSR